MLLYPKVLCKTFVNLKQIVEAFPSCQFNYAEHNLTYFGPFTDKATIQNLQFKNTKLE